MKILAGMFFAVALAAPVPTLAATVTGRVTFIDPAGTQVILNRSDAFVLGPGVSLAHVSVQQTISAEVSDDDQGVRTILKLLPVQSVKTAQPAHPLKVIQADQPVQPGR